MAGINEKKTSHGQIIKIPNLKARYDRFHQLEFNKKHHIPEIIRAILSYLDDVDVWCCFVLEARTWRGQAKTILQLRFGNSRHLDCRKFTVTNFKRFNKILQFNSKWFNNYITNITLNQDPKYSPKLTSDTEYTLYTDILSLIWLSKVNTITVWYGPIKFTLSEVNTIDSIHNLLKHRMDDHSMVDVNDYMNHSDNIKPLLPYTCHKKDCPITKRYHELVKRRIPVVYKSMHDIIENTSGLYSVQALELNCGIDINLMLTIPLHFYKHLHKLQLKLFNTNTVTLQQFILKLAEHSTVLNTLALLVDTSDCDDVDQALVKLLCDRRDTLNSLQLVDWTFKSSNLNANMVKLQHLDIRYCHGAIHNFLQQLQLSNLQSITFTIHPLEMDHDTLKMVINNNILINIIEVYSDIEHTNTKHFDSIYQENGYISSGRRIMLPNHFNIQLYCNKWCKPLKYNYLL